MADSTHFVIIFTTKSPSQVFAGYVISHAQGTHGNLYAITNWVTTMALWNFFEENAIKTHLQKKKMQEYT